MAKCKQAILKLPPYQDMKRMILFEGMSYQDMADKYGCGYQNVYTTFKRRAKAFGDPWPLQTPEVKARKQKKADRKRCAKDYYKVDLLALEIKEFLANNPGYSQKKLGEEIGIHKSSISRILNGHEWVRKDIADNIMAIIIREEQKEKAA